MRCFFTLFASLFFLAQSVIGQNERPNIVFIIADDINWNDIACYGNPVVQTPEIDQLAANGLRFQNAFLTISSCSPSRASIISGRYPHNTGAAELHTPLPSAIPVFPKALQEAGYHTAASGKWHMGPGPKIAFDTLVIDKRTGASGSEAWVGMVQDRPMDKPFFIWLASKDAHRIWQAGNQFSGTHDPKDVIVPPYLVDSDSTRADLARYYDEVKRFDHNIGSVVDELEKQGVLDNTLILVMADNGRPFPRCKTRVNDDGVKTPFVVHWPDGIAQVGAAPEALVSAIDIAPTFLQVAGLAPKGSFQGKSFAKLFGDPNQSHRKFVFAEHNWHDYEALERMARDQDFMYILNERPQFPNQGPADSNKGLSFLALLEMKERGKLTAAQADVFLAPRPYEELYDCRIDSMQLVNLASVPAYQEKLAELREVMLQWRESTLDSSPENLSPDSFERLSGKKLQGDWQRGNMPGKEGALETMEKGGD